VNKQIQIAAVAAAAIVLSGGGFVAGMTIGPGLGARADASAAQAQGATRQQTGNARVGPGGAGAGAGALAGQGGGQTIGRVLSVNNDGITVEIRTPGSDTSRSVIVLAGASSRIVKTTETDIKLSDIKVGDQVLVVGQPDQATGTISASAIVDGFNALGQLFGGGARPSGSGAPRPAASGSPRP
jgi:hypothetical protein